MQAQKKEQWRYQREIQNAITLLFANQFAGSIHASAKTLHSEEASGATGVQAVHEKWGKWEFSLRMGNRPKGKGSRRGPPVARRCLAALAEEEMTTQARQRLRRWKQSLHHRIPVIPRTKWNQSREPIMLVHVAHLISAAAGGTGKHRASADHVAKLDAIPALFQRARRVRRPSGQEQSKITINSLSPAARVEEINTRQSQCSEIERAHRRILHQVFGIITGYDRDKARWRSVDAYYPGPMSDDAGSQIFAAQNRRRTVSRRLTARMRKEMQRAHEDEGWVWLGAEVETPTDSDHRPAEFYSNLFSLWYDYSAPPSLGLPTANCQSPSDRISLRWTFLNALADGARPEARARESFSNSSERLLHSPRRRRAQTRPSSRSGPFIVSLGSLTFRVNFGRLSGRELQAVNLAWPSLPSPRQPALGIIQAAHPTFEQPKLTRVDETPARTRSTVKILQVCSTHGGFLVVSSRLSLCWNRWNPPKSNLPCPWAQNFYQ
ncbi:hypothetical protein B0H17DRAFT_1124230 [Mycena rosella]|uniref:Uncharacterized protein n=1 Tax=Mycena rosella TaxID=1033263 RepID=A0AAD7H0S6_MYCRO|nr:hypothetical protein B0H17DRAFT_1124230 [Mycena rosella]